MDCKNKHNDCCSTDMGRGCHFCNCSSEASATACEGCYKLHTENWLTEFPDVFPTDIVEVRFKNTRKSYYKNVNDLELKQGDVVAVEASPGHDIGVVSLTGDMVAKQMKRVGFNPLNGEFKKVYRKAKPYDIEKWQESIALEHETMIRARQIAADMKLNMKIGDVEYQGDKIKAIFYYIADERVDFRELIKVFADSFRIRIEMKQIGARQEAGRIGGLGSCGRELCCASWISSFVSVTTNAARTQEISLNPQKLAGQCSKLKCCLIYELDVYLDARKNFQRINQPLQALDGDYHHFKTDILGGTMTFSTSTSEMGGLVTIPVSRVKEIIEINRKGKKVDRIEGENSAPAEVEDPGFLNVVGEDSITRFDKKRGEGRNNRSRKGGNRDNRDNREGRGGGQNGNAPSGGQNTGAQKPPRREAQQNGRNHGQRNGNNAQENNHRQPRAQGQGAEENTSRSEGQTGSNNRRSRGKSRRPHNGGQGGGKPRNNNGGGEQ